MRIPGLCLVASVALASCKGATKQDSTSAVTAATAIPSASPLVPLALNDGNDPGRPVLPTTDDGFVDNRGGQGWADKCWTNIRSKHWGWAKAECDQAMAMDPASPQPRASMLFNEGLIAQAAGDVEVARTNFLASLALRENAQVRVALGALPASQVPKPAGMMDAAFGSDWAGTYEFVESCGRTTGGTGIVVGHTLVVSRTSLGFEADLDSNGWQTEERLHLTASASGDNISFSMAGVRAGNQFSA